MAIYNFTTWIEEDGGGYLTQTASRATATNYNRRFNYAYLYYDFGAGYWSGDFEFLFTSYISSGDASSSLAFVSLGNELGDLGQIYTSATGKCQAMRWFENAGAKTYRLSELVGSSTVYSDDYVNADNVGTIRYNKFKRDEAVGANGTLYDYIYSDAERTSLLDTLSLALHSKEDLRYGYVTQGHYIGGAVNYLCSGYTENLDLQIAEPPASVPRGSKAAKLIAAGLL